MPDFNKEVYDTEGPFGVPMKDRQAKAIEELLKAHPEADYKICEAFNCITEKSEQERFDVSWISTESVDRDYEIVQTRGIDLAQFQLNPIVTMNHNYWNPPVGRSMWQKRVNNSAISGIKAKTLYPRKPEGRQDPWPPDEAFDLIASGLMTGKSIGFIRLEARQPTDEEMKANPRLSRVITKSVLVEYACCWIPVNPDSVITDVNKSRQPFITAETIDEAIKASFSRFDAKKLAQDLIQQSRDKLSGRI